MKHKKKVVISAVLCFILMINGFTAKVQASEVDDNENQQEVTQEEAQEDTSDEADEGYWPEGPEVTAGAAVVMDCETGLILYDKNGTDKHYPASITKILTSLVAIENGTLTDTVTFSDDSVFNIETGSSRCWIDSGEQLSLEDCLYGILLESGNDCAYAAAEHVGGTYENFIDMMNAKAEELGCVNSHFANPHGLTEEDHYTCAYDMALIAKAAIKNTEFATIVGTKMHTVAPTNKMDETRYWTNHHKFVKKTLNYDGCIGGKTGWTTKSQYTLVTYAKRGDMTLVCVIMDEANPTNQYTETADLLDYGFDNFSIYHLDEAESTDAIDTSMYFSQYNTVLNPENPMLSVSEDSYVILPTGVDLSETKRQISYNSTEEATSAQSDESSGDKVIGTVTYTYNDKVIGEGNILLNLEESELPTTIHEAIEATQSDSEEATGADGTEKNQEQVIDTSEEKEKPNLKPIIVTIIIGTLIILLILYYFTVERPRIRRRKAYLERRRNRRYH